MKLARSAKHCLMSVPTIQLQVIKNLKLQFFNLEKNPQAMLSRLEEELLAECTTVFNSSKKIRDNHCSVFVWIFT